MEKERPEKDERSPREKWADFIKYLFDDENFKGRKPDVSRLIVAHFPKVDSEAVSMEELASDMGENSREKRAQVRHIIGNINHLYLHKLGLQIKGHHTYTLEKWEAPKKK